MLVVPESEKQAYGALHGPGNVVTVPDENDGLIGRKVNACIELFEDGATFALVDDDFLGFRHVKDRARVEDSEAILEAMIGLVQNSDTVLAGWNISQDPIKANDYTPFSLTKAVYAAVVIKKTNLRHPEWPRFSDTDYFLQVANAYRGVFRDNRYYVETRARGATTTGGCDGVEEKQAAYSLKLLNKWGSRVITRSVPGRVKGVHSPLKGP